MGSRWCLVDCRWARPGDQEKCAVSDRLLFSPPIGSRDWRRFFAPVLTRLVTSVPKPRCYVDPVTADRLWSYDRYPRLQQFGLQMIARVRSQLAEVRTLLVMASGATTW